MMRCSSCWRSPLSWFSSIAISAALRCVLLGEQPDDALGDVHASGGVQARRHAEGDVAGAERTRAVEVAVGQQRPQPGIDRLAQAIEPQLGEDAVLAHQRYRIGDGRNGDHLQERRQQALAAGLLQQRLRNLEGHSRAAQRLAGILAALLIRIDHRQRLGHAFRMRQVMVGNDEVDAAALRGFGGGKGANAGIHADDDAECRARRPAR